MMQERLADIKPSLIVVEKPQYFAGGGQVVAATGSLVELAIGVGAYIGVAALMQIDVVYAPVNIWKGNLPKSVTAARVGQLLGINLDGYSHDQVDAIGIGLWHLGRL